MVAKVHQRALGNELSVALPAFTPVRALRVFLGRMGRSFCDLFVAADATAGIQPRPPLRPVPLDARTRRMVAIRADGDLDNADHAPIPLTAPLTADRW